jgi:hypothetical protein
MGLGKTVDNAVEYATSNVGTVAKGIVAALAAVVVCLVNHSWTSEASIVSYVGAVLVYLFPNSAKTPPTPPTP